jgi:hypothetical protein
MLQGTSGARTMLPPPDRRDLVHAKLRRAAGRMVKTTPLYRALPPGRLRDTTAVLYHADHSPDAACRYLEQRGTGSAGGFRSHLAAAQAAFRTRRDELAEELLTELIDRYPARPEPRLLLAELLSYRGEARSALDQAVRARLVCPTLSRAASAEVRFGYQAGEPDADDRAAAAVARFPTSATVLWAAGRGCSAPSQFVRIRTIWREAADRPERVLAGVRPLAHAAARVGELDEAVSLHAEGMVHLAGAGPRADGAVREKHLRGTGAAAVVREVVALLEDAGIPFFLAAGTALGYVREGGPLGHDADIDVGVFAEHWDRDRLLDLFDHHPSFRCEPVHPTSQKVAVRHRGGAPIDVFRFYREGDRVFHDGTFVRWWNQPFGVEWIVTAEGPVPLPAPTDGYLSESYGDWRVPRPDFDAFLDGPNVEVVWPAYRELYLVRRAYARLSTGEVAAATADLGQVRDTLARSVAGRELAHVLLDR